MADVSSEEGRAFKPSFPFYLVYGDSSLLTGRTGDIKVILAYATREFGELVCSQCETADLRSPTV
jgi:hypothetical protein